MTPTLIQGDAAQLPLAGQYRTIVADPPWRYRDKLAMRRSTTGTLIRGAESHYSTMPLDAICVVPVGEWAAPDAHLYLWITNAFLLDGTGARVCEAWGFEARQLICWVKPGIGMGHWYRNNVEHVIFAVRGRAPILRKDLPTCFIADRRAHSEKPQAFLDLVEMASPGPHLEVFARQRRLGWDVVGDAVGVAL